jgi:transposase
MRKSFNGLSGMVRTALRSDPLNGHLFCFFNRRRTYVKILYWDTTGYALWSKRLVKGTFSVVSEEELTLSELDQVLDGIDLRKIKKNKRYSYKSA